VFVRGLIARSVGPSASRGRQNAPELCNLATFFFGGRNKSSRMKKLGSENFVFKAREKPAILSSF
jgi:hypothetical protein